MSSSRCSGAVQAFGARVVVLGGYGNFGARICRSLARDEAIEVVAAGRNAPTRPAEPRIRSAKLDITTADFAARLAELSPRIVIHCAGPFQNQDYRVALASIAAGAHYIDLADGRDFVCGFAAAVDASARAAGLVALTGASTLPALSSAVVDELLPRFRDLHEIQIAIAPGQRGARGAATIQAVLSYAGKPFAWRDCGEWKRAWGWQELRSMQIAQSRRLASACDVPDLQLLPARYPSVRTVQFRAALEFKVQHIAIWLAAALRRAGVPVPLERWSGALDRLAGFLDPFAGATGGMLVALRGQRSDGKTVSVEWHLSTEATRGPEIPCMASVLLARKLLTGGLTATGAHACMGFLSLADFAPELARWGMSCSIEECVA